AAPLAETAADLHAFMTARYEEHVAQGMDQAPVNSTALGFLLAGYDHSGRPRILEASIPGNISTAVEGAGAAWRGQTDVIARVVKGADVALLAHVAQGKGK